MTNPSTTHPTNHPATIPQPLLLSLIRCAAASPDVESATITETSTVVKESASPTAKQFQAVFQINFKPLGRAKFGAQLCPIICWTYEEPEEGFAPGEWDELVLEKGLWMHIALVAKIKREAARLKVTKSNKKRYKALRNYT